MTAYHIPDSLSGVSPIKILAGTSILGVNGSVPVISNGADPAQGVGQWGDGALAVYPSEGYRKGGAGAGEIKVTTAQLQSAEPDLVAGNIKSGVAIYGVTGTLKSVTSTTQQTPSFPIATNTATEMAWNISLTIAAGATLDDIHVRCGVDSGNYVSWSGAGGVRLFSSASYNKTWGAMPSYVGNGPNNVLTQLESIVYNSATGLLTFRYAVYSTSGGLSFTTSSNNRSFLIYTNYTIN
jgi:hypothetical protein